ncbi:IPT/TIG domain-containing protein [Nocardia niwae]|uniref:IPT/TIG domain-containing protein n=1 Tax=Nocardia niwae TaxID=626084 RepID=UPI0007A39CEB|nr:IPT/TIG domain-containing protein [Nocardia niwae]
MAAVTFEQLAAWNQSLIRRPNKGFVLIGDDDATIPPAFTDGVSAEFQALTDFESLGLIAKDAPPTFRPEVQSNDIESWGAIEPTRTDILSVDLSVSFTAQETKRRTLELYTGIDLSAIEADATTGEIQYNNPTSPETRYNRLIFGMVDGAGADAIYILKVLPRATVTEIGEQSWSQESALTYNFTVKAKIDPVLGYSMKNVICGPGVSALLAGMGFTATAAVPTIASRAPGGNLATAGGEQLILTGQHFTGTTAVTVGGTAAADFQVGNDTTLAFITPAKTAGSHNIVVTNATGPSAGFAVTYA